ncbi:hypothetical protein PMIN01_04533 [Paraphaeosphaeria minitans]|uniref:Uncharacterized protein n=1 Tax=Paraphaeosphaeria minitans TaxID=565426 RepID=A0A9P6GJV7_9PLEO|nr:hypothetical protein PMIN01_04533 [Paraphaeosphaeria minitans]
MTNVPCVCWFKEGEAQQQRAAGAEVNGRQAGRTHGLLQARGLGVAFAVGRAVAPKQWMAGWLDDGEGAMGVGLVGLGPPGAWCCKARGGWRGRRGLRRGPFRCRSERLTQRGKAGLPSTACALSLLVAASLSTLRRAPSEFNSPPPARSASEPATGPVGIDDCTPVPLSPD